MSPVFVLVKDVYGVSTLVINCISYSFMALYLPSNFPCTYITEKYGLRWAVICGMLTTTLGLWVRTLLNIDFTFALIGNIIVAAG